MSTPKFLDAMSTNQKNILKSASGGDDFDDPTVVQEEIARSQRARAVTAAEPAATTDVEILEQERAEHPAETPAEPTVPGPDTSSALLHEHFPGSGVTAGVPKRRRSAGPGQPTGRPTGPATADMAVQLRSPLYKTMTRRAVDSRGDQRKIEISLPRDWYARLESYEDRVLQRHGLPVVRTTVVHEALRQLPEDLDKVAPWLPSAEQMSGARQSVDSRLPLAMKVRLRQLHGRWRRDVPGLTVNDVLVAAMSMLITLMEMDDLGE